MYLTCSLIQRYGVATVTVVLASVLMLMLNSWLNMTNTPFVLFFGAVMVSASYGGIGPGLVATFLSAIIGGYFLISSFDSRGFDIPNFLWVSLFFVHGILISILCEGLRTANKQALMYLRSHEVACRLEISLAKSEERLRNLAANIPGVMYQYFHYPDGREEFSYISSGCYDLFGIEPEEIQKNPQKAWEVIHPDDIAVVQQFFSCNVQPSLQSKSEWRIITPSGQIKWLQSTARAYPQADDSVVWDGVLIDISEQKAAQGERKRSEARFRHLFESNMIGMKFWTHSGEITSANQAYLNIIGYTKEDLQTGRLNVRNITPPEYWALEEEVKLEIQQRGVCTPYEKEYIRKDGSRIPVLIGGARFDDPNEGGICFVLDLLERKKLENKLRQQAANLEQANRAKDEFLAVLSHELRTPLSSILGFTQMLRSGKLKEQTTVLALETIQRNAQKQKQLIEDLLDISRILQNKVHLSLYPINLASVIEAAVKTVRPSAEEKSIDLEFSILDSTTQEHGQNQKFFVSGDFSRLQQIVYNLLDNAIKFTPTKGRIEVRLLLNQSSTLELFSTERSALVQVIDNGSGISSEFLPYVFERFRQADTSITRKFGGLGIGLAIVRHIVELHGGTVQAESLGEGQGATFSFELPLLHDTKVKECEYAKELQNELLQPESNRINAQQRKSKFQV
jgi:PAS domain S-box-containing protein